jgi:hypothetical protein
MKREPQSLTVHLRHAAHRIHRAARMIDSGAPPVLVTRASETRSDEIRISRPVARVSGWSVGRTVEANSAPCAGRTATSTA